MCKGRVWAVEGGEETGHPSEVKEVEEVGYERLGRVNTVFREWGTGVKISEVKKYQLVKNLGGG